MLKSLEQYLRKHRLVLPGERIGLAVSGGADSVALLRAFAELAPSLGVVLFVLHLNHNLRGPESLADERFVRQLATRLALNCAIESTDVASLSALLHLSLEAAGRRARYTFFSRAAAAHRLDCVATAHTRDDQAETVLLRLLRGTGTSGLAGIHRGFDLSELATDDPSAELSSEQLPSADLFLDDQPGPPPPARLIRPLLSTTRQQVEDYLLSLGQPFRQDASNLSPQFLRNRVRGELLPTLERDYNPRLREALCETAEIAAAENAFLEALVSNILGLNLAGAISGDANSGAANRPSVPIALLQAQPLALQRRILRRICRPHALALDFAHLEALRDFALAGHAGRHNLPRGFVAEVLREKHSPPRLLLRPPQTGQPTTATYSMELPIPGRVLIGEFLGRQDVYLRAALLAADSAQQADPHLHRLSSARVGNCLAIRNLLPGDRFHPLFSGGEKKINRLLQELSIPSPLRRRWPVVLAAGRIVWVPGLAVAEAFAWSPGDGQAIVLEICSAAGPIFPPSAAQDRPWTGPESSSPTPE